MNMAILVEPTPRGFRAASGAPLDLDAVAESADAAIAALRAKIADRMKGGAFVLEHALTTPPSPFPIMPLHENPMFDEWLEEVGKYRDSCGMDDPADEAAG